MSYAYTRKHHISGWDPEDRQAWDAGGAQIAKRNLVWSIICEHIGFSIWSLFSVMALSLKPEYGISLDQKFAITATATPCHALTIDQIPLRTPSLNAA